MPSYNPSFNFEFRTEEYNNILRRMVEELMEENEELNTPGIELESNIPVELESNMQEEYHYNREHLFDYAIRFERNLRRNGGTNYMNMSLIDELRKQTYEEKIGMITIKIEEKLDYLQSHVYWTGPLGAEILQSTQRNKCVSCGIAIEKLRNNNIGRFMSILNDLFNNAHQVDEKRILEEIKDLLKELSPIENNYYEITKLFKNKFNKILFLENQFRSFHSFCNDQNSYDNMISIIKILQRIKHQYGEEINIEYTFKKENHDDFSDIEKEIKESLYKELNGIRFLL